MALLCMQPSAYDAAFIRTCRQSGLSALETSCLLVKEASAKTVKEARRRHHIQLAARHIPKILTR